MPVYMARVPASMSHYRESDVYIDENANIGSKKTTPIYSITI